MFASLSFFLGVRGAAAGVCGGKLKVFSCRLTFLGRVSLSHSLVVSLPQMISFSGKERAAS